MVVDTHLLPHLVDIDQRLSVGKSLGCRSPRSLSGKGPSTASLNDYAPASAPRLWYPRRPPPSWNGQTHPRAMLLLSVTNLRWLYSNDPVRQSPFCSPPSCKSRVHVRKCNQTAAFRAGVIQTAQIGRHAVIHADGERLHKDVVLLSTVRKWR